MPWFDEKHHANFLDYFQLEIASGGPDQHMKLASMTMHMADSFEEKIWRAGCYVSVYEVCTGSEIWSHWPYPTVVENQEQFRIWIQHNWNKLQFRRERRAARTPTKLADCLISIAKSVPFISENRNEPYDWLWTNYDQRLMYFGRYALIKILETLYLGEVVSHSIPDIRPKGGWSPRMALAWLDPNNATVYESKDNSPETLGLIQETTERLIKDCSLYIGRPVRYYELEVILCNYRQGLGSRYPGRSLDTDLGHYKKACQLWGSVPFPFETFRKNMFPVIALGELHGWDNRREELGSTFTDYGYFWSDLLYDYHKSRAQLHSPVPRRKNES